jgi:MoxR-like ATPase
LLDEIDKAEPVLPDNLLVPLGSQEFRVEARSMPVTVTRFHRPLIVITSNDERDLSAAFRRRCVRVRLGLPSPDQLVDIACGHVDIERAFVEDISRRLFSESGSGSVGLSPAEFIDAVRAAAAFRGHLDAERRWEQVRVILGWPGTGPDPR